MSIPNNDLRENHAIPSPPRRDSPSLPLNLNLLPVPSSGQARSLCCLSSTQPPAGSNSSPLIPSRSSGSN